MFEALSSTRRIPVAQPALAFAVHAGIVALAVGGSTTVSAPPVTNPDPFGPSVIYVPDRPRPGGDVPTKGQAQDVVGVPPAIPMTTPPGVTERPPILVPGAGLPDPRDMIRRSGDQVSAGGLPIRPDGLYKEEELSDPPEMVDFSTPVYPAALLQAGIVGVVTVSYIVDARGRVEPQSVTFVSTDRPEMAEAVRVALAKAVFRPGRIRGQPVRVMVRQSIRFTTSDN